MEKFINVKIENVGLGMCFIIYVCVSKSFDTIRFINRNDAEKWIARNRSWTLSEEIVMLGEAKII